MNEVERSRIARLLVEANRGEDAPSGALAMLCRTVAIDSYPTAAASYFGVVRVAVDAEPAEGSIPVFDDEADAFLAANIGAAVPPVGTLVLVFQSARGLMFKYG